LSRILTPWGIALEDYRLKCCTLKEDIKINISGNKGKKTGLSASPTTHQLSRTVSLGDYGLKSPITFSPERLGVATKLLSGSLHVQSSFLSKSRRRRLPPPAWKVRVATDQVGYIVAEHPVQMRLMRCCGTLSKMVHAALSQIGPTDSVTQS